MNYMRLTAQEIYGRSNIDENGEHIVIEVSDNVLLFTRTNRQTDHKKTETNKSTYKQLSFGTMQLS